MGGFVSFNGMNCGYSEERIGFGHGKQPEPYLQLYKCDSCKTVGSARIQGDRKPLCSGCYNENIELLDPKDNSIPCPKCDTSAVIKVVEDTWA